MGCEQHFPAGRKKIRQNLFLKLLSRFLSGSGKEREREKENMFNAHNRKLCYLWGLVADTDLRHREKSKF